MGDASKINIEALKNKIGDSNLVSDILIYRDIINISDSNDDHLFAYNNLKPLADNGNADACRIVADCFRDGKGVQQSLGDAVKWYRLAADQGDAAAQLDLGLSYNEGLGVAKSQKDAVKWFRLAADQGNADAQENLGWCYKEGNGVAQSQEDGVKWLRLAADQGHAAAQWGLGWCYKEGEGVTQSWEDAVKWFRLAADQGDAAAQLGLGWCYKEGKGVAQSREDAIYWCRKSADNGMDSAIKDLPKFISVGSLSGGDRTVDDTVKVGYLSMIGSGTIKNKTHHIDSLVIGGDTVRNISMPAYLRDRLTAGANVSIGFHNNTVIAVKNLDTGEIAEQIPQSLVGLLVIFVIGGPLISAYGFGLIIMAIGYHICNKHKKTCRLIVAKVAGSHIS